MPHRYHGLRPMHLAHFDEDFLRQLLVDSSAPRDLRMTAIDLLERETLHELLARQQLAAAEDSVYLGYALTRLISMAVEDGGELRMTWRSGPDGRPAIGSLIYYDPDPPQQGRSQ